MPEEAEESNQDKDDEYDGDLVERKRLVLQGDLIKAYEWVCFLSLSWENVFDFRKELVVAIGWWVSLLVLGESELERSKCP